MISSTASFGTFLVEFDGIVMFVKVFLAVVATYVVFVQGKQTRVTCIGDSITEGGGCVPESYTDLLQKLLGEDYLVTNAGKSSQTMLKKGKCNTNEGDPPSNYGDCSYWNTDAWTAAKVQHMITLHFTHFSPIYPYYSCVQNDLMFTTMQASQPDIVTIMLGTNDAKAFNWEGVQQDTGDYFALDAVDMVNTLRRLDPVPQIYLLVPPRLYAPYPFEMNATIINTIYPVLVRDIATVTGSGLIDVYSAFANSHKQNLTCDGCHPEPYGNYLIAHTIATSIRAGV